ncbi:MAG: Asp-tRNA(Asn)/Glu-tRNA(Gln) amidotransferase subunit GatC [Microbacteriaceae bacterium]|jgi:aspartyl-tRNA(Asn)/glutamyl-tRNA(Gln) amidotransferase subunit C|nr:Asp-tRNA(Asn)/Glu-tRNA(Gln) amidotransferase subunit GatC [Microbacteriaceae bacterium]MBT5616668.1 Asp-tRNA(Asn)/Glu-tRNA(Gln) amidotransferase subunit GatC [Microbacteriaceae bacterium]MBT5730004.1 Asp-tRNA(Asn)/Glu-tRNA(Gln) amidotransferase subunit GatC [Microbacteriaceae bacterium]MBT7802647.1 Asp-tRNA(Asn)/Glu-tRNA(Gln) amidotransferase subunit GatC [Microbacteriaceae bacterium]
MSQITPEDVSHLAGLARIALSEEEISKLTGELGAIVSAVESIKEVATQDVVPTSHPIPLGNVFREDVIGETLTTQEALSGAPDHDGSRFRVTAILGEEQ